MAIEYILSRDFLDNNRINLQHYLWKELFGYLIHPSIPTENPDLRIADVGTGTSIWLTDLSRKLPPTVSLEGLDISFEATPPQKFLPSNLRLRSFNVLSEVPEELVGIYDIVHVRVFAFVLKDDEIRHAVKNLFKLLKPGGYIQWGDSDIASFRIETADPSIKTDGLAELLRLSQPKDSRMSPKWVADLPKILGEVGFGCIEADIKDAPLDMAFSMHENNLMLHEIMSRHNKDPVWEENVKKLLPKVCHEAQQGACWAFTRYEVVGRKPL